MIEPFKQIFIQILDMIAKVMIKLVQNEYPKSCILKQTQIMLMTTTMLGFKLFTAFELFEVHKHIFSHLNETVLHLILIWFFEH